MNTYKVEIEFEMAASSMEDVEDLVTDIMDSEPAFLNLEIVQITKMDETVSV